MSLSSLLACYGLHSPLHPFTISTLASFGEFALVVPSPRKILPQRLFWLISVLCFVFCSYVISLENPCVKIL